MAKTRRMRALRPLVLRAGVEIGTNKVGEVAENATLLVLELSNRSNGSQRALVEVASGQDDGQLKGWVTSVLADGTENFATAEPPPLPPPPSQQPLVTPATPATPYYEGAGAAGLTSATASAESSLDSALLSEALVFSAKECAIEAGGKAALVVPVAAEGGFLLYQYAEASGEGVRFTVRASEESLLLDELQPASDDRLRLPAGLGSATLTLEWHNTESWIQSVVVSYTIRVVSTTAVRCRLERQLLAATLAGQHAAIQPLLAAGATVGATDRHGNTAMHLAALSGASISMIRALSSGGADVNARNAEGATPLLLAAFRRGGEAGTAGAAGSATGSVHAAAAAGGASPADTTAAALITFKADVAASDSRGNTALMIAAGSGQAVLVRQLLEAGALHTSRNARGDTALSLAAARGSDTVVAALLSAAGPGGGGGGGGGSGGGGGGSGGNDEDEDEDEDNAVAMERVRSSIGVGEGEEGQEAGLAHAVMADARIMQKRLAGAHQV